MGRAFCFGIRNAEGQTRLLLDDPRDVRRVVVQRKSTAGEGVVGASGSGSGAGVGNGVGMGTRTGMGVNDTEAKRCGPSFGTMGSVVTGYVDTGASKKDKEQPPGYYVQSGCGEGVRCIRTLL